MCLKSIKIILFFLLTDRIRTLYHTIGYCAFLNNVSDPDSGTGRRANQQRKKKKTEFTLSYIYLNVRVNKSHV